MKIFLKIATLCLLTVALFNGCKKNAINYSDFDYVDENSALIKINYNVAFKANPSAQIKLNGVRVSATTIKTRYPFPGGGLNTEGGNTSDYLPIPAGNTEVSISIPKRGTNIDSVLIYKTTMATQSRKHYTLHVADTVDTKSLQVEEDRNLPDSGFVKFRFVNLMPNVPAVDLYIGTVKVASNVAFMSIGDKFELPVSQTTVSTVWAIRPAGALPTSTALATYTSVSTLLNRRIFTVFATGYSGMTSTDPRRAFVSFYSVR